MESCTWLDSMQKRGKAGHLATCLHLVLTILWALHCTGIGIVLTTWDLVHVCYCFPLTFHFDPYWHKFWQVPSISAWGGPVIAARNWHSLTLHLIPHLSAQGQIVAEALVNKFHTCFVFNVSAVVEALCTKARPTSLCILFDSENISFDASLVIYINSTNIPPIMIINRIYEHQNPLSP
jgi:hypothetical protein